MSEDRLSQLIRGLSPIRECHTALSCCCNLVSCENHKKNELLLTQLEEEALLLRYENTLEASAVERNKLQGKIQRLEQIEQDLSNDLKVMEDRNKVLASDNSRFIRLNEKLLRDLESLNMQLSSTDERIEHLSNNLRSTHLEIERLKRLNSSLEPQLEYLSSSNSQLSAILENKRSTKYNFVVQSSPGIADSQDEYVHNLESSNQELRRKVEELSSLVNKTQAQLHELQTAETEKDIHLHYHYHLPTDIDNPFSTPPKLASASPHFPSLGKPPPFTPLTPSLDIFEHTRLLRRAHSHESSLNPRSSLLSFTPTASSAVTSISSVFASPRLNRTDGSIRRLKRVSANVSPGSTSPWLKLWGRRRLNFQENKTTNTPRTVINNDELRNSLQDTNTSYLLG